MTAGSKLVVMYCIIENKKLAGGRSGQHKVYRYPNGFKFLNLHSAYGKSGHHCYMPMEKQMFD